MRETVINLELTSVCNRRCATCPQGNPNHGIEHADMDLDTLSVFLDRVDRSMEHGLFIREIINSGYGETFLHRRLPKAFEAYAEHRRRFVDRWGRRPDISIVTNGSAITERKLEAVLPALDILKFSFPTSDPGHYNRIMMRSDSDSRRWLDRALQSMELAMTAYRDRRLKELRIHISPPCQTTFEDIDETLDFLTKKAADLGLDNLRLVTFPSTSNRAGGVRKDGFVNTFYRDQQKRYDGRVLNGVKLAMLSELHVFYPTLLDVAKVLRHRFPCIWKGGSISIDHRGRYRFCINDATSSFVLGTLEEYGLEKIYDTLAKAGPSPNCPRCNQNPAHMGDDPLQRLYSAAAKVRMASP